MFPNQATSLPGFGQAYKRAVREQTGAYINLGAFGEVLARKENRVMLDPAVKDKHGVPVLKFDYKFGENEIKMAADMADQAAEMLEAGGYKVLQVRREWLTEGWSIHELGTSRMGADPKTSFCNSSSSRTTLRTCSSSTGAATSTRVTSTRPGPSWPWRYAPASTWPTR